MSFHGIQFSSLRWHQQFVDVLRDLHFNTCKAEQIFWMDKTHGLNEYNGVFVDEALIFAKDLEKATKQFKKIKSLISNVLSHLQTI
jgi:hypothetical protein